MASKPAKPSDEALEQYKKNKALLEKLEAEIQFQVTKEPHAIAYRLDKMASLMGTANAMASYFGMLYLYAYGSFHKEKRDEGATVADAKPLTEGALYKEWQLKDRAERLCRSIERISANSKSELEFYGIELQTLGRTK